MTAPNPDELAARDALAAEVFPALWALVVNATGERARRRRHALRRAAPIEVRTRELRSMGANCSGCAAWRRYRHGPGHVCDDESTGGTYTKVDPDHLCANWRAPGQPFPRRNP